MKFYFNSQDTKIHLLFSTYYKTKIKNYKFYSKFEDFLLIIHLNLNNNIIKI